MSTTPFDTVKDLQTFLSQFPADTPLTTNYDGTGRVSGVASLDADRLACVAIFPTSEAWLTGHDLPTDNPILGA